MHMIAQNNTKSRNTPQCNQISENPSCTCSGAPQCSPERGSSYLGTTLDTRPNASIQDEIAAGYQSRYDLLKVAQSILHSTERMRNDEKQESIVTCCTKKAPLSTPKIIYNATNNKASVRHVEKCNSDSCPVCAGKKANDHRENMIVWLSEAQKAGLYPIMVTLTMSHHAKESLAAVADAFGSAYGRMFSSRWWQSTKAKYALSEKVYFSESPVGENGWHVHAHVIILSEFEFVAGTSFLKEITDHFSTKWQKVLRLGGRYASWERGVDIVPGESEAVNYVTKYGHPPKNDTEWGVESEATQGHNKTSQNKGIAPFELLAIAGGMSNDATSRFCEIFGYSEADRRERPTMIEAHAMDLYEEYYRYWKGQKRVRWGEAKSRWNLEEKVEEYRAALAEEVVEYEFCAIDNYSRVWFKNQLALLRAIVEANRGNPYAVLRDCKAQGITVHVYTEAYERFHEIDLE